MNCLPEARATVRRAADRIGAVPEVETVDVLTPERTPTDSYELEVIVSEPVCPSTVAHHLGSHGLALLDVTQRGEPVHTVVRARA